MYCSREFLSNMGINLTLMLDLVKIFNFLFIRISATSYLVYFDIWIIKLKSFNFRA